MFTFPMSMFGVDTPSWALEVTTTGVSQTMTIGATSPNLSISWGDGISEVSTATTTNHVYTSAGTYTLRISGSCDNLNFNNANAQARLTAILSTIKGLVITSCQNLFRGCSLISTIPSALFDETTAVTTFNGVFRGTSGITGNIPTGLFDNNTLVNNFLGSFQDSAVTGSIPTGLFDNNTAAVNFTATFAGASGLTGAIPTGLFDSNTLASTFNATFKGATGLTGAIPAGLFDNNTSVGNFFSTFDSVSGLTSIPTGLFDNNTLVTNFRGTFFNGTGLTGALPIGLFDNNTLVETFQDTFSGCTGITKSNASTWAIGAVSNMSNMFNGVTLSTGDYNALLIGWEGQAHQSGVTFSAGNSIYSLGGVAETARTTLDVTDTWTITDGGGISHSNILSTIFNGVDECVDFGQATNFERTDTFSEEFYFKSTDAGTTVMLSKAVSGGTMRGVFISLRLGVIRVGLTNDFVGNDYILAAAGSGFDSGDYYHLIVTYDGSSDISGISVYIDGVSQAVGTLKNTLTGTILNATPLTIGCRSATDQFFNGNIDEVVTYNKELSQAEVTERYNAGVVVDPLLSTMSGNVLNYWPMGDGDNATTIFDNAGSDDGTLVNMDASNYVADVP